MLMLELNVKVNYCVCGCKVYIYLASSLCVSCLFLYTCWCFWSLQRLLVVELLSVGSKVSPANILHWSEELYPEEFGDLSMCNLLSEETCEPVYPRLHGQKSDKPAIRRNQQPDHDVLQA